MRNRSVCENRQRRQTTVAGTAVSRLLTRAMEGWEQGIYRTNNADALAVNALANLYI
jgi:hypothetical protein